MALVPERFAEFHPRPDKDDDFFEQVKLSRPAQLVLGALGIILLMFGIVTLWSTYSSYTQRKSLHESHVELIMARRATLRNREIAQ